MSELNLPLDNQAIKQSLEFHQQSIDQYVRTYLAVSGLSIDDVVFCESRVHSTDFAWSCRYWCEPKTVSEKRPYVIPPED